MITTTCIVCGARVVVSRHPEHATCSAECARRASGILDLHISHAEWLVLRNGISSAVPGVPRVLAFGRGILRMIVDVEAGDSIAEHKAVAP